MNEFNTVGMSAVSTEELEQTEGGYAFILGILAGVGVTYLGAWAGYQASSPTLGSGATGLAKAAGVKP